MLVQSTIGGVEKDSSRGLRNQAQSISICSDDIIKEITRF